MSGGHLCCDVSGVCFAAGCLGCLAFAGCAWCESSCTCKSAQAGVLTAQQCPANSSSLVPYTSSPSACPSASGALCDPASGITAVMQVQAVSYQQLQLDGAQSSRLTLCSALQCGSHGVCVGSGLGAACACSDGWQGESCQLPPSPCYAAGCGGGLCLPQTADSFVCLCTDGSLAATCSDSGSVLNRWVFTTCVNVQAEHNQDDQCLLFVCVFWYMSLWLLYTCFQCHT